MKCECYKSDENGAPVCFGTKEREICACHGDTNKCDFHYFDVAKKPINKENFNFQTIWDNYTCARTKCLFLKNKKKELSEELQKISKELEEWQDNLEVTSDSLKKFKNKIDYDELRTAVINYIYDTLPLCLFDLINDKIYNLTSEEIFNIANELNFDFEEFIKGE